MICRTSHSAIPRRRGKIELMMPVCKATPEALHLLVWHDNPEDLERELERTASLQVEQKSHRVAYINHKWRGMTALSMAAQLGRLRCIEVLLRNGADTLVASEIGYYPLQDATGLGDREAMRLLLTRRHEQLRDLWKRRQPFLTNALRVELPDFFLEMKWQFKSWLPFLSMLCPNDTYRVWKRKNRVRVDTTLIGFEKLTWTRGNVSFLFDVNDDESHLFLVDHDRKIFDEVDKLRDFTPEEVEDDINSRLNSEIMGGHIGMPKKNSEESVFTAKGGSWFGFGAPQKEVIGEYQTHVYTVSDIEVLTRTRKEHLLARPDNSRGVQILGSSSSLSSKNSNDTSGTTEFIADIQNAAPQVEELLADARRNLYVHVPTLPRPDPLPSVTQVHFFQRDCDLDYLHCGRPMAQVEKGKTLALSVWMAEKFPLSAKQLLPFFEILTTSNKHFEKVRELISMQLPPGFPVQIEIPIFAFLTAQVTFLNFEYWARKTAVPEFASDGKEDDWFSVPANYKPGVVLNNILRKSEEGGGL